MNDQRAGVVPLTVVAAKKPGKWIVRAMGPFRRVEELRQAVERHVGTLDTELVWTTHTYEGWPGYVIYGKGDLPALQWPTGVFLFRWTTGDCYRSDSERLGSV